jgi:hypothetical protein
LKPSSENENSEQLCGEIIMKSENFSENLKALYIGSEEPLLKCDHVVGLCMFDA